MTHRRHFLQMMSVAGIGCIGMACGGGNTGAAEPTGSIPAGNVSALAVGALSFVPGHSVVIGRDAAGVYAMTSICTHAQCDMETSGSVSASGVHCSCHDSSFDANGTRTGGPAASPLKHFLVVIAADGAITVNASSVVSADTRLAVA